MQEAQRQKEEDKRRKREEEIKAKIEREKREKEQEIERVKMQNQKKQFRNLLNEWIPIIEEYMMQLGLRRYGKSLFGNKFIYSWGWAGLTATFSIIDKSWAGTYDEKVKIGSTGSIDRFRILYEIHRWRYKNGFELTLTFNGKVGILLDGSDLSMKALEQWMANAYECGPKRILTEKIGVFDDI